MFKAILTPSPSETRRPTSAPTIRGNPEPDPELRDTENVPLDEDVQEFFAREVKPHVPDAWINTSVKDQRTAGSAGWATRLTSTVISTSTSRHGR